MLSIRLSEKLAQQFIKKQKVTYQYCCSEGMLKSKMLLNGLGFSFLLQNSRCTSLWCLCRRRTNWGSQRAFWGMYVSWWKCRSTQLQTTSTLSDSLLWLSSITHRSFSGLSWHTQSSHTWVVRMCDYKGRTLSGWNCSTHLRSFLIS